MKIEDLKGEWNILPGFASSVSGAGTDAVWSELSYRVERFETWCMVVGQHRRAARIPHVRSCKMRTIVQFARRGHDYYSSLHDLISETLIWAASTRPFGRDIRNGLQYNLGR